MSQRDLAEKSGVSIAALNQYENEGYAPGVDKLCMLAEALGCSPDELLGWE